MNRVNSFSVRMSMTLMVGCLLASTTSLAKHRGDAGETEVISLRGVAPAKSPGRGFGLLKKLFGKKETSLMATNFLAPEMVSLPSPRALVARRKNVSPGVDAVTFGLTPDFVENQGLGRVRVVPKMGSLEGNLVDGEIVAVRQEDPSTAGNYVVYQTFGKQWNELTRLPRGTFSEVWINN